MISVKKKTLAHPKSCPLKRAKYLSKLNEYIAQGFAIVYMDESGFESETLRPFGYAPIGKPCIDSYNWQGKKRTNVIGALYKKALSPYGRIVVTPKKTIQMGASRTNYATLQ